MTQPPPHNTAYEDRFTVAIMSLIQILNHSDQPHTTTVIDDMIDRLIEIMTWETQFNV